MMRIVIPLLFVAIAIYWTGLLLWFIFVEHFVDVVATVLIISVVLSLTWGFFAAMSRLSNHD